jgi:uridine phosphorylase
MSRLAWAGHRGHTGPVPISDVPIVDFDADPEAYVRPGWSPGGQPRRTAPEVAVGCFFPQLVAGLADQPELRAKPLRRMPSLIPFYETEMTGRRLGVFYPGVGAPLACLVLENVIAMGARTIILCGGAGALAAGLPLGHVVVPDSAVREEGTSYHYLPPSAEVQVEPAVVERITGLLTSRGIPHTVGRTWTTDGIYRETPGKVARYREAGCVSVDMEASAALAVAKVRGVQLGLLFFAADDLSGPVWEHRGWLTAAAARQNLFDLAAAAAFDLADAAVPPATL